jgi:hypothetical protein
MKEGEADMIKSEAVRRRSRWGVVLMAVLAVVLPGCGGDNSSGPNGTETFTDSRTLAVLEAFGIVFTAQRNGTVDANVNWNSSNNDIDIYATAGTCPSIDAVLNGSCNVIAFSESGTAKPETVSFGASNGTTYRVWALNLGPGSDTVTIRLTAR